MDIGQVKSKKVKGKSSISQSYCIYLCIYKTVKQFGVKIGKIPENCAVTGCGRNKNKEIVSLRFVPVVFGTSFFSKNRA
jgi:hypothetical protein